MQLSQQYFRIGTMSESVVNKERGDIDYLLKNLKEALEEAGYRK